MEKQTAGRDNWSREVYGEDSQSEEHGGIFGMGEPNINFAKYFIGNSYLKPLTNPNETKVFIANVTFEPRCRNNWHIHHATSGGGQILICVEGSRLVSGRRQRSTKFKARRCYNNTCKCKILAWS